MWQRKSAIAADEDGHASNAVHDRREPSARDWRFEDDPFQNGAPDRVKIEQQNDLANIAIDDADGVKGVADSGSCADPQGCQTEMTETTTPQDDQGQHNEQWRAIHHQ